MKKIALITLLFFTSCSSDAAKVETDNPVLKNDEINITSKVDILEERLENKYESTQQDTIPSITLQDSMIFNAPIIEEAIAIEEIEEAAEEPSMVEDFHDYTSLSLFLGENVNSNGKVNYARIKSNIGDLNFLIKDFEENYPTSSWSKNEELAYWINVYNLYTLKLVASNYPITSITKITAKPWDKKFIKLGGALLSLNDVEHKKIRARYNEPRIHFALNCASQSCPKLLNTAFTSNSLNYQLTRQTKNFLKDISKNNFSNSNEIVISSLFDWYKNDFVKKEGSVVEFINKYSVEKLVKPTIKYMDYSWELND